MPVTAPSQAANPNPSDTAIDVSLNKILTWDGSTGGGTITYHVYFGTSEVDVANGIGDAYKGSQLGTSYEPGLMKGFTTYYWRIDVENEAGITTGDVWEFTTKSFAPKVVNAINRPFPVTVEVHFDVQLLDEKDGALDPDNYTFNHGAYATSVRLIDDKQVRLTVENLFEFDSFTVTVSDKVRSFSEESVNPSFNSYSLSLANRPFIDEDVT